MVLNQESVVANTSAINGTEEIPTEIPSSAAKEGEVDWDSDLQSIVLGSFFYGHVLSQIPGGLLAEKYGAKWLFGISNLVPMILTVLSPLAIRWSVTAFIVIRVIQGLGQGLMYPAMHCMLAHWIPKQELTLISTVIYTGALFGIVLSLAVTGMLCDSSFLGGWPSSFYIFGFIGLLWCVLWFGLVYDTPTAHPRISQEELLYIKTSLDNVEPTKKRPFPWCAVLKSVPVWALCVVHVGHGWGFNLFFTQLPTYQKNVLHFGNTQNGLVSAMPYLAQGVLGCVTSYFADVIRRKGYVSTNNVRKWSNTIGLIGPALCLLGVTLVDGDPNWNVALITTGMALNGLMYSGFMVVHVEMAPDFAGTLMGISNTLCNFTGFLAPSVVGFLVQDGGSLQQWTIVFYICIAMYAIPAMVFHIWGTTKVQSWA